MSSGTTYTNSLFMLRMRNLPKPEYKAMKAMKRRWHLRDDSELFAVLIRLASEVMRYHDGQGEQWVINVIESMRSIPESDRMYDI